MDIGTRIKELRAGYKMTQAEFARRLGISKSAVSSYENGSRLPSYDILLKIARIFRVSTDLLLDNGGEPNRTLNVDGLTAQQIAYMEEAAKQYRKLNLLLELAPEDVRRQAEEFGKTGQR